MAVYPARAKGPMVLAAITLSLAATFWLAIFGQLIFLAPMTQKLLGEFKMRTPWMTERVIFDFMWVVPVIGVVALVICIAVRKKWAWGFTLLVLPLLISLFITMSLFLPTLELLRGIAGQFAQN